MNTIRVFFSMLSFLLIHSMAIGQSYTIEGELLDNTNQPIIYATLSLFSSADSSLVKVEASNENGNFSYKNIQKGQYWIEATYIGFDDLITSEINLDKDTNLGKKTMSSTTVALDEAVVTAQRSIIEVKPDRMVFNVQGTLNSTGDNGLELLRKAPGVVVDNNDNISVLGRNGVMIFVDGKRLPISGDQLSDYLRNLTSDQIDRIDIISNPGAKYEAEGNAGIIDIRLKKDKNLGSNGTLSLNAGMGRKFRGNLGFSGNHRTKKTNLFGNINYNKWNGWNKIIFDNYQNGFRLQESNVMNHHNNSINYRAGMDFFLTEKSTIGVLVDGSNGTGDFDSYNRDKISNIPTPNDIDSILIATNASESAKDRYSVNVNYVFRSGEKTLNIDADFGRYKDDVDFLQPNTYYDGSENTVLRTVNTANHTLSDIEIYTLKLDYEIPLLGGNVGTGFKLSKVKTDNTFLFYDVTDSIRIQNNDRSNNFVYDENVYAAYANYSTKLSEKWGLTTGLRLEQTDARGDLTAYNPALQEDPVLFDYLDAFPSIGLSYQAAPMHAFNLNIGRRINRPDYNVLNPFRTQLSELSFMKGNPYLKPEIVNNAELGYTWQYRYNFKLSYSKTTNQITRLIAPDDDNPKAGFLSWDNLAEQTVINFNASLPLQLKAWWSMFVNINFSHIQNEADYGNGATINLGAYSYNLYTQNTFVLGEGYTGEISGWYSGPGIWGGVFIYEPSYSLNFGFQKKFFDALNCKISFQDVTYQSGWSGESTFNGLYAIGQGNWDSRRVNLSLTYNFGNSNVKARKRMTGNEAETGRIKSGNE
ncbi:MAG TPA: TonB-dependent receptor [Saprospiraceae bacterium]|nr:TonB-dependent receptor [Saprospiraceae bacterium]